MPAGALLSIFNNRRREGFPFLKAVGAQLLQRASPATEDEPARAKGLLRSRTTWSAAIGLAAFIAIQIGVPEGWVTTALHVTEALGIGGTAVFRALGRTPMRED